MINVNRLRVLREVKARGGIAGAAEALFMTPSAVSQQMGVLEREAGVELLERVGRGVRLTSAGQRLVAHAERVLALLEEAEADMEAIAEGMAGTLHVAAFPTAARTLLVPALGALRKQHPQLEFTMSDLEPEESLPALKVGQLDVVVTYEFDHLPEPEDPGIERHLLLTEPMWIAMPSGHPLAASAVRVRELHQDQWIVGRDGSPFLDVQVRVANEAGFNPRVDLQSNDYQVILAAVSEGLGVALVPPMARMADYPGVVFAEMSDIEVHRRVVANIRKGSGRSPAIAAALEALRQAAKLRSNTRLLG